MALQQVQHPSDDDEHQVTEMEGTVVTSVCAVICLVVIAFDIYYYFTTKRIYEKYNTPNKELLQLLDDREKTATDLQDLQRHVKDVLSYSLSGTVDRALKVNAFLDGIKQAGDGCDTELIKGARDGGTLPIRKDNRVKLSCQSTNLHVSEVKDLYGNPMYLAAAPLSGQFEYQWDMIWEKRIGVLVWIGRFSTHERRMDQYIELSEGGSVNCGPYRIKTVESGDLVYKFSLYYIQVTRGKEKRDLVVLHAYEWIQETVTWALKRDVELVHCVKEEHLRRMKTGDFRGVLFQCKIGTAGSATMLTAYLAYQTWMHSHRVNLYGLLRYVRKMRAMAFVQTGDPGHTFLAQVQIAYAVTYGLAKYYDKQRLPEYERWIQELLWKQAEQNSKKGRRQ